MKSAARFASVGFMLVLALILAGTSALKGQDAGTASSSVVPPLIKFNGIMTVPGTQNRTSNSTSTRPVTATFSLYEFPEGGTPLWSETQKVQVDEQGHYVVLLGETSPAGLPLDLFASGKALWLGVQPQVSGAGELPRMLLAPVPYALKASDSDTLGGKPASAFALAGAPTVVVMAGGAALPSANPTPPGSHEEAAAVKSAAAQPQVTACTAVTSDGTAAAGEIAKFTAACNIEKSLLRDTGTGVAVGGTATPAALFDVQFTSATTTGALLGQRVLTTLNPASASSATANGFFSNALTQSGNAENFTGDILASISETDHNGKGTLTTGAGVSSKVFNLSTGTITNAYGFYAGLGNASTGKITNGYGVYLSAPTNATGGTFSNYTGVYIAPTALAGAYGLYSGGGKNYFAGSVGIGTTTPAALLEVSGTAKFDGLITFTSGQTFPIPAAGVTNAMLANSSLTVGPGTDLTGGGLVALGGKVTLNLDTSKVPTLAAALNTFQGGVTASTFNLPQTTTASAGMITIGGATFLHACCRTGAGDTFVGSAGNFTTTGSGNTGTGQYSLWDITGGSNNTAAGIGALEADTSGGYNTGSGYQALQTNSAGSANSAMGACALVNTGSTGNPYQCVFSAPGVADANTALGVNAGATILTGNSNTFLGFNADATTGALTNATALGANAKVGASNAMVLGGTGANAVNVGIGTSTPGAILEVDGPNQLGVWIKAPENGVGAGLDLFTTGTDGMQWEILNTGASASQGANALNIRNVTGSKDVLTLLANGNVGIGTTAPSDMLSVNGSANKVGGGSWGTFSDARLKTVEGTFQAGLAQVLKLNPVVYRYRDQNALGIKDHDPHVGFVAQEVEKVVPEAVSKDAQGYRIVNNDPILWTMLNAIKEQQNLIQKQRAQISAQEARLQAQQAQIDQLASQVTVIQALLKTPGLTGRAGGVAKASVAKESGRTNLVAGLAPGKHQ
jgi:uncharacterized protein YaiE (UPF0345 family)